MGHQLLVGGKAPPLGVGGLVAGVEGPRDSHCPMGELGFALVVAEGFLAQQEWASSVSRHFSRFCLRRIC